MHSNWLACIKSCGQLTAGEGWSWKEVDLKKKNPINLDEILEK